MRQVQFPFAKYRAWDETPPQAPEVDTTDLLELGNWQATSYRRPIFDEITAYPNFYPSLNGAAGYTQRPTQRLLAGKKAERLGITQEELAGKIERQPWHVAEYVELATAIGWTAANLRHDVLKQAISVANDISEWGRGELDEDTATYAADAIADYGYCLRYPADPDFRGEDHGSALAAQINRVAEDIGQTLEHFGLFADWKPEILQTADGITVMEITREEQERRIAHWRPRHEAITGAYPTLPLSEEILLERIPLSEMLILQSDLGAR
ncbi:MAG: hypothetical protein M3Q14_01625 [bacterium]|nr:hypothetical protein [bacterium]